MTLSKITFSVLFGLSLVSCSNKMSHDGSLEKVTQSYQQYENITKQYHINAEWWKNYNDPSLNHLVQIALANNIDLANATITMNNALYNANLLGANLLPKFSAAGSATISKGVGHSSINSVSTGTSNIAQSLSLSLNYTLDLWQRLANSASAAEWTYKATAEDLAATRLTLLNSVINAYYNLCYLKEAIALTQQSIGYYEQIQSLLNNKMKVGIIDGLAVEQATQAVLNAKNTLISLQSSQKTTEQTLRNLLNLKPSENLEINYSNIAKVKTQGIDLNVPVSAIANRPDVKSTLLRLQSNFKSLVAMENSWFPTLTIGASLSARGRDAQSANQNLAVNGTLISFDLPFLDWSTVKNNIKISENNYQAARLNYEKAVTTALNEINTYYYNYGQYQKNLENLQQTLVHNKQISAYYKNRYNKGISEFREWINAINTEKNAELAVLQAKYHVLQYENLVYQAMAGKYTTK